MSPSHLITSRFHPLWAAFSFLTRLAPAHTFSNEVMAASPRWFPLVGLVLGLLTAMPLLLAGGLPWISTSYASMLAWLYVALMFWATRGLHWDGLCDCFDAWGSGARGEKFQAILKDSRLGAFGALGAMLAILAQWSALESMFRSASATIIFPAMILAPALGRTAMLALAASLPPHPVSTLGRMVAPGCSIPLAVLWWGVLTLMWILFFGLISAVVLSLFCAFCLCPIYRLAKRECGFNGDFLGCSCLITESACLWAAAFTLNLS